MVETNFKQTEIGPIPEDWDVNTILSINDNIIDYRGVTPKKIGLDWGNGDIVALSAGNVKKGYIDYNSDCYYGSEELYKRWMRNGNPKKGDIAFTMEAPLGNVALIPDNKKYILSQRTILLQLKGQFDPNYIFQIFLSTSFQKYISESATGSTAQGIKRQTFEKLIISLPLLPEQQAIATALSNADVWIESLEKLIAKKRLIKQGAMQHLLTPKEDWEVKKLGEIVKIKSGESPSKFTFVENGVPYFKVEQLNNGTKYAKETSYYIQSTNISVSGSIIFPKRGASIFLNKIRILYSDSFFDTNLMSLTCSPEICNEFVYYSLSHYGLDNIADTTSIPQINNKHIIPFEIPLPPILHEQIRIANILSDMDSEIDKLENKLQKAQQIKQGMMQQLLTGKIRLVAANKTANYKEEVTAS